MDPWPYHLVSAFYGNYDVKNILQKFPLQECFLSVGKILGSLLDPSKKLIAIWHLDQNNLPDHNDNVFFTGQFGKLQNSHSIVDWGNNRLIGYKFESQYLSSEDLFMNPNAEFTRFFRRNSNGTIPKSFEIRFLKNGG